jgi:phosphatidylserine/phosphatidylglycerophosphate/cardiolipin synthase-like enzyme
VKADGPAAPLFGTVIAALVAIVAVSGLYAVDAVGQPPPLAFEQHFAPEDNLEAIDVRLIDGAARTLDMAAYVLTDVPVIEALTRAARRGVRVRLFRQVEAFAEPARAGEALAALEAAGAAVRYKDPSAPLMHLKAYCIDGSTLRVGAANFSASGLKRQDNDLEIARGENVCAAFDRALNRLWEAK